MRRHNPPYPSILLAMTATVLLLLHTHSALALSPNQSNPLWMYSAVTEEVGTGVGSLNFNAPYHSIRAIASLSSLSSRYTFNLQPFIPVTASLQSFNWELSTPPAEFPPWLTFIGSWVESSEFVLGFNATTLFSTLPPIDPPPFVIQLTGTVYYTHGPQRYIEQETRLLNLIVHYHVYRPLFERSTMLSPFTSSQQSNSITLLTTKTEVADVGAVTIEPLEVLSFECGGNEQSITSGCRMGGNISSPVFLADGSGLIVKRGVLRVTGPVAAWGTVAVSRDAVLVLDGDTETTLFAVMSDSLHPLLTVDGTLIVKKGIFRVVGSPFFGTGKIRVESGAKFEFDPRQESTFGSAQQPCYNARVDGDFMVLSGRTRFDCALQVLGLGMLHQGMSASTILSGKNTHVLGGYFDGTTFLTSLPGVNLVGSIISGSMTLDNFTSVYVGGGSRIQGLGHVIINRNATLRVKVEFYEPASQPDALIAVSGPVTERVVPGVTNDGTIYLDKGGLRVGTSISSVGIIRVKPQAVLTFTTANALNEVGGSGLVNEGSVMALNGANVDFRGPVFSNGSIYSMHEDSKVIFSSQALSYVSMPALPLSTPLSKSFALFSVGSLVLRDKARVAFGGPMPTSSSTTNYPRFFSREIVNSGGILLYNATILESNTFNQTHLPGTFPTGIMPTTMVTSPEAKDNPVVRDRIYAEVVNRQLPFTYYVTPVARLSRVPLGRYSVSSTGVISESAIPTSWVTVIPTQTANAAPSWAWNIGDIGPYSALGEDPLAVSAGSALAPTVGLVAAVTALYNVL